MATVARASNPSTWARALSAPSVPTDAQSTPNGTGAQPGCSARAAAAAAMTSTGMSCRVGGSPSSSM